MEDEGDYCRICRGEADPAQPLYFPCKCSGSIKFVHQDCLMEWLSHSQKKYCELCKTPFRFTKLYDRSMPARVPIPTFVNRLAIHILYALGRWLRYILVTLIWLCWLPWSIRQVWRGLFWLADGSWISEQDMRVLIAELAPSDSTVSISANATTSPFNFTFTGAFLKSATLLLAPFTTAFGSGEAAASKLLRQVFPSAFNITSASTAIRDGGIGNPANLPVRRPSLLSELTMLKSITSTNVLNNVILDVLEGQVICLLVITAFILVFLIREWVINQQPLLHAQDAVRAEQPDLPNIPAPLPIGPQRRQRRAGQRGLRGNGADMVADDLRRQARPGIPILPRRAATTDDLHAEGRGDGHDTPSSRNRAGSFDSLVNNIASEHEVELSREEASSSSTMELRPLPPARRAPHDAIDIGRIMEEQKHKHQTPVDSAIDPYSERGTIPFTDPGDQSKQDVEALGGRMVSPTYHADGLIDTDKGVDWSGMGMNVDWAGPSKAQSTTYGNANLENLSPQLSHSENALRSSPTELSIDNLSEYAKRPRSADLPDINTEGTHIGITPDDIAYATPTVSSVGATVDKMEEEDHLRGLADLSGINIGETRPGVTPDGSTHANPATSSSGTTEDETEEEDHLHAREEQDTAVATNNAAPITKTFLEPVIKWLWEFDFDDAGLEHLHRPDGFAAFEAGDDLDTALAQEILEPGPDPAPLLMARHNDLLDLDADNIEALEDAEDLDGILELVGIRGPIAGMVQNVIFSEFLITLTMAASIWLPYLWGKIALLVLANPIGVFVKAPVYVASRFADTFVDFLMMCGGLVAYALDWTLRMVMELPFFPDIDMSAAVPGLKLYGADLMQFSGSRLEATVSQIFSGLKPDLPSFSMQSRYALHVFGLWLAKFLGLARSGLNVQPSWVRLRDLRSYVFRKETMTKAVHLCFSPAVFWSESRNLLQFLRSLRDQLRLQSIPNGDKLNISLLTWETEDKIAAIFLGYVFFAVVGAFYLKLIRLMQDPAADEKVGGVVADSLRQAGGVLKVVVIIGIEMIIFPLYCGLLLDAALLPLFAEASLWSRTQFIIRAPITAVFVHWFIGTCYMFHFALFVSMCRKIFRKGVLYFIRDPDDPTFHPVRDVLERSVLTQLGKIAYSAFIYGGLVIMCLGGVVWLVSCIEGVLPVQWTTIEPRLSIPIDVAFYNFLLPVIVRKADISRRISLMYEWWFRGCAAGLRLTHFLFGEEVDEEKKSRLRRTWMEWANDSDSGDENRESRKIDPFVFDGGYVRVPANDSVRIPKGQNVFLDVNDKNERVDGKDDPDKGYHGRFDERFSKVYIPPHFRARMVTFIILLWGFTAFAGVIFTVGPLLLGRATIKVLSKSRLPPNDLYALTVGLHICAGTAFISNHSDSMKSWMRNATHHPSRSTIQAIRTAWPKVAYIFGLLYLAIMVGIVLPILLSVVAELYTSIPIWTLLMEVGKGRSFNGVSTDTSTTLIASPELMEPKFLLTQAWTIGLVWLRIMIRVLLRYPSRRTRASRAIRAIVRHGWWHPDVRLATRALILPILVSFMALLIIPLFIGSGLIASLDVPAMSTDQGRHSRMIIFRTTYPLVLMIAVMSYVVVLLRRQLEVWSSTIKDEVYLVGERLHNLHERKRTGTRDRKGKAQESTVVGTTPGVHIVSGSQVKASQTPPPTPAVKEVERAEGSGIMTDGNAEDSVTWKTD